MVGLVNKCYILLFNAVRYMSFQLWLVLIFLFYKLCDSLLFFSRFFKHWSFISLLFKHWSLISLFLNRVIWILILPLELASLLNYLIVNKTISFVFLKIVPNYLHPNSLFLGLKGLKLQALKKILQRSIEKGGYGRQSMMLCWLALG